MSRKRWIRALATPVFVLLLTACGEDLPLSLGRSWNRSS